MPNAEKTKGEHSCCHGGQYPGRKKLLFFKFSFMTLYDPHYIEDLVSVKDAKLSSFGKGVSGFK